MPHHGAGNPDDDRACKQPKRDAPQAEAETLSTHVSADLFFGGAQTAQQTKKLGPLQNTDVKAAGNHDRACGQHQQKQHQRNAVKGIAVRISADAVEPEKPLVFLNLARGQAIGGLDILNTRPDVKRVFKLKVIDCPGVAAFQTLLYTRFVEKSGVPVS